MDAARNKYDSFKRFSVSETCLPNAQPVFVAGKLEAPSKPDGALRVAAHPDLFR